MRTEDIYYQKQPLLLLTTKRFSRERNVKLVRSIRWVNLLPTICLALGITLE